MLHHYADDGRILTPPKELQPMLKGAFSSFARLLGHIRFFYVADEIWDGMSSLIFRSCGDSLATIALRDGFFHVAIANEKYKVVDETLLDAIFDTLRDVALSENHRPIEQLTMDLGDPNQFPCGRRCDLCLGSKNIDKNDFSESENFGYLNWLCYHNCLPDIAVERWDGVFICPGCAETRRTRDCRYFPCPTQKGYANCVQCGEYHVCDTYRDSHHPGECSLGLTSEEVTSLVMPYCVKERLDMLRMQQSASSSPMV